MNGDRWCILASDRHAEPGRSVVGLVAERSGAAPIVVLDVARATVYDGQADAERAARSIAPDLLGWALHAAPMSSPGVPRLPWSNTNPEGD